MNEILKMIAITFIPTLELRASIPYGIFGTNSHWFMVFIVCVIANFIIGIMIFIFLDWIIKIMCFIKPVENTPTNNFCSIIAGVEVIDTARAVG